MNNHSVMNVHIPAHNAAHRHFAFVSEEISLTKQGNIGYDKRVIAAEYQMSLSAGVYGFANAETRDTFIVMINRSSEMERAFVAKFGSSLATSAVADEVLKEKAPRRKKRIRKSTKRSTKRG